MSDRPTSQAALPLIEALVNGTLDEAGFAELERILLDDADARSLYRSYMNLHTALPGVVGSAPRLTVNLTDASGDTVIEPHDMPHADLMQLLIQVEAGGTMIDPATLVEPNGPIASEKRSADGLTGHEWQMAGRYLLSRAMTWKVGMFAAAAVIALACTLVVVFSVSDASNPIATNPDDGVDPADSTLPTPSGFTAVASLTAERDAGWDRFPGEDLYAGQRFTLTQGFAEITTNRGAVAILEAPATIELINENALHLHTGKLVGICETESSKGFIIRTPHMDVTDLGTRFGVDANGPETQVHVIDGLVEVAARSAFDGRVITQRVAKGQAVVSSATGLAPFTFANDRFVTRLPGNRGPVALPGDVAWYDHPLSELTESEDLQVYTEKTGLVLKEDLVIDIDGKGNRPTRREPDALTVPAGTAVDVYMLHLDTPGSEERIGSFTVRFDRPILGVIGRGERLDQTDALFAPDTPRSRSGSARGAIEDLINPDLISADGRTLRLTLRVATTTDQLRVLVAAENE